MNGSSRKKADINLNNIRMHGAHKRMKIADTKAFANEFFNRQIIMKEIGKEGQRKLAEAKVAVVGAADNFSAIGRVIC